MQSLKVNTETLLMLTQVYWDHQRLTNTKVSLSDAALIRGLEVRIAQNLLKSADDVKAMDELADVLTSGER